MVKIIFWNAEGGTDRAKEIAHKEQLKLDSVMRSAESSHKRHGGITRAVTRSQLAKYGVGKASQRLRTKAKASISVAKAIGQTSAAHRYKPKTKSFRSKSRAEKLEVKYRLQQFIAERARDRFEHKAELMHGIMTVPEFPHVFLCEMVYNHPDRILPKHAVTPAERPKCYAYYVGGVPTDLPSFPTSGGAALYGGPALPPLKRLPRAVVIDGVLFCFWHAPSGNNGQIVKEVFDGLSAAGNEFVLFGDLNTDPVTLEGLGMNAANIIRPRNDLGTRISGRMLDYALTNVPGKFASYCYPLQGYGNPAEIKFKTGSDHSPMVLEFTG